MKEGRASQDGQPAQGMAMAATHGGGTRLG
jgi:hypothetical protein